MQMANEHAIRIHELGDDTRSRLCDFVKSIAGSYVFARETDATRTHLQGWIRCDLKQQALRARLKKAFPECVGNKGYSISLVKDHEKYARYILKGTKEEIADIVCYCGLQIDEEYLQAEHRAYWSTHGKPSKSNRSIVEDVEEWATSQKWPDVFDRRRDVAQRVCDVITARKKAMNLFYARGVYNTVMYRMDNRFAENFVEEIISKY